jgi:hypothetical protein
MRPPIAPGDSVPDQPQMARLARFVSVFFTSTLKCHSRPNRRRRIAKSQAPRPLRGRRPDHFDHRGGVIDSVILLRAGTRLKNGLSAI